MITKFLFMDEKYADQGAPQHAQVISLTGILVPADVHSVFHERFYGIVCEAVGRPNGVIPPLPLIHASNLLPDADDNARFSFLYGLVKLIIDLDIKIYRLEYFNTLEIMSTFKKMLS